MALESNVLFAYFALLSCELLCIIAVCIPSIEFETYLACKLCYHVINNLSYIYI